MEPLVNRARCFVFVGMSLDGFLAGPGDDLGWLKPFEGEEHGYAEFFASVDTLVVGRRTYDVVRGFESWPYSGKRCVVLTHRPLKPLHGEEPSSEAPGPLVARLSSEGARTIYVDGGIVIRQFLAADLVDELTVSVVPMVVGNGVPLFAQGGRPHALSLIESRAYPSGLVRLRYRRAVSKPA
jgi:dihydrofolate reductase